MRQTHIQLLTREQMVYLEKRAIERGRPSSDLMEAAGQGVINVLRNMFNGLQGQCISILCGKGKNGGDGFVVARLAAAEGATVSILLFASKDDVQTDAHLHLKRAQTNGLEIQEILKPEDLYKVDQKLSSADVALDALLGTGVQGGPKGLLGKAIGLLSKAECPVVAIDLPSGLNPDTGSTDGPCAIAARTITFGLPKRGHFFYPGRLVCGQLFVVDIGLPVTFDAIDSVQAKLIAAHGGSSLLPKRVPVAHKGEVGRILLIAGSAGLTGAATLSASAALRGGAGMVTVGVPESLNDILEIKLTEAMTFPLPEVRNARCLSLQAKREIKNLIAKADSLVLGPGLGTHRETIDLVKNLIQDVSIPTVLDADALNALAGEVDFLKALTTPIVITPHPKEFSNLTGVKINSVLKNPIGEATDLADATGITVVLKGAPTIVAIPGKEAFVNPSGNAGMATAGAGDVLAGLVASLIGQGLEISLAAILGVYMHGLAGDIASETIGQAGLVAGDIVDALPMAEQMIRKGKDQNRYIWFHPENTSQQN